MRTLIFEGSGPLQTHRDDALRAAAPDRREDQSYEFALAHPKSIPHRRVKHPLDPAEYRVAPLRLGRAGARRRPGARGSERGLVRQTRASAGVVGSSRATVG